MPTVGFEPTRANTEHLKCSPLDRLGHVSIAILGTRQFDLRYHTHTFACCNGIEPHPVINSDWLNLLGVSI